MIPVKNRLIALLLVCSISVCTGLEVVQVVWREYLCNGTKRAKYTNWICVRAQIDLMNCTSALKTFRKYIF
jgi:hypothetical protein